MCLCPSERSERQQLFVSCKPAYENMLYCDMLGKPLLELEET